MKVEKRKVLISAGMTSDGSVIITDAPEKEIIKWCYRYNRALQDGTYGNQVTFYDSLKEHYYVKIVYDSELDAVDDLDIIGYDECYDLFDYKVDLDSSDSNAQQKMNSLEFFNYINEKYILSKKEARLIYNIICFVEDNTEKFNSKESLYVLFSGLGISNSEIDKIDFSKEQYEVQAHSIQDAE